MLKQLQVNHIGVFSHIRKIDVVFIIMVIIIIIVYHSSVV